MFLSTCLCLVKCPQTLLMYRYNFLLELVHLHRYNRMRVGLLNRWLQCFCGHSRSTNCRSVRSRALATFLNMKRSMGQWCNTSAGPVATASNKPALKRRPATFVPALKNINRQPFAGPTPFCRRWASIGKYQYRLAAAGPAPFCQRRAGEGWWCMPLSPGRRQPAPVSLRKPLLARYRSDLFCWLG